MNRGRKKKSQEATKKGWKKGRNEVKREESVSKGSRR